MMCISMNSNFSTTINTCSNCKGDKAYLKDSGGPREAVEEPHGGAGQGQRGIRQSVSASRTRTKQQ